ncbi:MAG TPA: type II toxin-antitoxin system HicA family toxin [Thermomicrobiales bacterium]|nr:type II toxin-antitoxin system HicA family toxin [Thermomicrobiales bacterium]
MNRKQRRTLAAIYTRPTPANVPWSDIVSLFVAVGATVTQGRGSRVRVNLNGVRAVFHEPHPEKEASKGAVEAVRDFLETARVEP